MAILSDLINIAQKINMPGFDDVEDLFDDDETGNRVGITRAKGRSYDSIAKQAKEGVMQFPFIATCSLDYDTIQMVAKGCERNFASFMQTIFSMNQITNAAQPQDFVRQFHQNMSTSGNGPADAISFVFNASIPMELQRKIRQDILDGNVTYEEMFRTEALNDQYLPKNTKIVVSQVFEAGNTSNHKNRRTTTVEAKSTNNQLKYNLPRRIFADADVKKSNEVMPTLMHVVMTKEMPDGAKTIEFIVGVKATIHPVESADMIEHLVQVFQERGKLFRFLQWTTGEISFFKDLVFGVERIKGDIKGIRSGEHSKWWVALKNAKAKARMHKYTLRSPILPNASLVVSSEEVEYIKANYGFDLLDSDAGKKIVSELNILSLYIVDSAAEVVHIFLDGQDHYDVVTFRGMQRDTGNSQQQFKDILKAVNKLQ